jgi:NAD(P)-dependent dehydrogenase (short-subunit alcohol dehydrogenase family)
VITGCSSGIGMETALYFARNGYYTFATVRDLKRANGLREKARQEDLHLETIKLDVTNAVQVYEAIKHISESKKRVDVLINNGAYGLMGAIEDISLDQIRLQIETNFIGTVNVIQDTVPLLRASGGGKIINISSTNGMKGYPLFSAYNSSKFALEGLTETIRYELKKGNNKIYTVLIEFGPTKTNFAKNLQFGYKSLSNESFHYEETKMLKEELEKKTADGLSPQYIASRIYDIALLESPKLRYFISKDGTLKIPIRRYELINYGTSVTEKQISKLK